MNQLFEFLYKLIDRLRPWRIVSPWEVAIRVRLGKHLTTLGPGFHLILPILDEVTIFNTRTRITATPTVTMMKSAGGCRMVTANIGYRITDPIAASFEFEFPTGALVSYTQAEMALGHDEAMCQIALQRRFEPHGVSVEWVRYVENVEVRPIRLFQGTR